MKFMNRTGSEPVNSAELHFPGLALNGIEVRPNSWRLQRLPYAVDAPKTAARFAGRVKTDTVSCSATRQRAHALRIGYVESFEAKLQHVPIFAAPGQFELLRDAHVE